MTAGRSARRAFVAVCVVGALLLLLGTPLCATKRCPMGERADRMGCKPLTADCCQTRGERTAAPTVYALPPTPLTSAIDGAAAAAEPAIPDLARAEIALPAILQGVGLHTFLAVFLI